MIRAQGGDRAALQELLAEQVGGLYRYARHLTGRHAEAEDLVQETCMRAMTGLGGFRGECAFQGWLYRIAMNLHLNERRARGTRPPTQTIAPEWEPAAPAPATGDAAEQDGRMARLRAAIATLPARQQEVILLHTYERMDSQTIAKILGCSYETVRMNLSHARRRLRELLAADLEDRP